MSVDNLQDNQKRIKNEIGILSTGGHEWKQGRKKKELHLPLNITKTHTHKDEELKISVVL